VCFVVVCYLSKGGVGCSDWNKYCKANNSRHDFQIDLGIALLNRVIELEWDGESNARPEWMCQGELVPCKCKKCFFCVKGLTFGIEHKRKKQKISIKYVNKTVAMEECTDRLPFDFLNGRYCKMYYRKQPKCMKREKKVTKGNFSNMGCL